MPPNRFEIQYHPDALKDIQKLDGSIRGHVKEAITKLYFRADEIGEPLSKKNGIDLSGCRKLKLKKAGIRIVYKIHNGIIKVVQIIAIGKRDKLEAYQTAAKRLLELKQR